MNAEVKRQLIALNRTFYQTFGQAFAEKRQRLQPGVRRVIERFRGDERILDLGCGNGELARQLARRGHRAPYLGLDFSPSLLEEAGRLSLNFPAVFLQLDLTSPDWERALACHLTGADDPTALVGRWDVVTAFAVLHHIPGHDLRLSILRKVRSLLPTGGRFWHSEWMFLNSPRLRARVQDWSLIGLSPQDVDEGDYLLDWRHGGRGLRYVHHFTPAELAGLAGESGFVIVETFSSDGKGGRLGLYQEWEAR